MTKLRAIRGVSLALLVFLPVLAALLVACGPPRPITVGGLIAETGPAGAYGQAIRQGMDLALEEVNAGGGVLGGAELKIDYRDTATNPDTAQVGAIELLDEGVPAVIGPVASNVALRIAPLFNKKEIVLLSPAASSPRLTKEGGDWFFRVYPSDNVEAHAMAEFCRKLAITRVAIVAVDDVFGKGIADVFQDHYQAPTRLVVYRKDFGGALTPDAARAIVREMRKAKAEAVYIAAYQDDMKVLLQAMHDMKCKVARLGTSAVTEQMIAALGEAAEGLVFPRPAFDPDAPDPKMQAFAQAFRTKYHRQPDIYAAHGYDAVKVLAEAIDKAGIATAKEIRAQLLTQTFVGVTGRLKFNLNGDVVKVPKIYAVLNGEIVPYEEYRNAKVGKSILAGE